MPPVADPSCPQCGNETADGDSYCWSCGTSLTSGATSADHQTALMVEGEGDAQADSYEQRRVGLAALVLIAVVLAGVVQLGRDRTAAGNPQEPLALESVLEASGGADSTAGAETDTATELALDQDGPEADTVDIRIDTDALAARGFDGGHLVFADGRRKSFHAVDLETGALALVSDELDLPDGARVEQVSDLGVVVTDGVMVWRWNWDGSSLSLGTQVGYLGGNTISFTQVLQRRQTARFEIAGEPDGGAAPVVQGNPYFFVGDSIFTQDDTSILRFGPGDSSWEEIGTGAIGTVIGDGVMTFDCLTEDPQIDETCLMDIYRADGTRAVSSRTASQLRWNVTAGGRDDVGLVLSHNGEMLAEPTQVGLGVWNTAGGTLRRISRIPLAALQWTADDRAVLGLGPSRDGWAPVMELDIARGTTEPIGIEVAGLDLVGLGDGGPAA